MDDLNEEVKTSDSEKVTELTQPLPEEPKIEQLLLDEVSSLKALATLFQLLKIGSFQIEYAEMIISCGKFVTHLHQQMLSKALGHPQAELVPELKAELDKIKEAEKRAALEKQRAEKKAKGFVKPKTKLKSVEENRATDVALEGAKNEQA